MLDPAVFRHRAERCRVLLEVAIVPEVIEQLALWADDFEEEAQELEGAPAAARGEAAGS